MAEKLKEDSNGKETSLIRDWKDRVKFRVTENTKDEEEIIDFVNQHFVPYEPLNVAINICEPGYRMFWFDSFVRKYITEGLSLMAEDTITGELVGVAVCTECKRSPEPSESGSCGEFESVVPRWAVMPAKFGLILDFLENLTSSVDIFEKYNVNKYLELFILSTHSIKRYPGLGTEIVVQSLALAKQKGFQLYVTDGSSFFSQKIFSKLGFVVLKEMEFEEYRPHGQIIFPKYGMHDTVKLFVKTI